MGPRPVCAQIGPWGDSFAEVEGSHGPWDRATKMELSPAHGTYAFAETEGSHGPWAHATEFQNAIRQPASWDSTICAIELEERQRARGSGRYIEQPGKGALRLG